MRAERSPLHTPTRVFLVLLRLAIGWHFFYEGWYKIKTYEDAERMTDVQPWSAEPYLRAANGPLAPYYRTWLLDDPGGLDHLVFEATPNELQRPDEAILLALEAEWKAYLERFAGVATLDEKQRQRAEQFLRLNEEQMKQLEEQKRQLQGKTELTEEQRQLVLGKLDPIIHTAREWLKENREYLRQYVLAARALRAAENRYTSLTPFEKRRLRKDREGLEGQRNYLLVKFAEWMAKLHTNLMDQLKLSDDQRQRALQISARVTWTDWRKLDWINVLTRWGLLVMGIMLLAGFLTPLASFGGVVFLAGLYFAMPPWLGLPGTEVFGGHYLIINPHVIEAIALLAVAGSGRWFGVDALFHRRPKTEAAESDVAVDRRLFPESPKGQQRSSS